MRQVATTPPAPGSVVFPPLVDGGDVLIRPSEMMRQLMHGHMRHHLLQRHIPTHAPFVQNGPPKQPDRIRRHGLIHRRFLGHRNAGIQTGQLKRVFDADLGQQILRREIHHRQRHIRGQHFERGRQVVHRGACDVLDHIEIGRGGIKKR